MQWLQDPCQINVDNQISISGDASRRFRNKEKEYLKAKIENLKLTVR